MSTLANASQLSIALASSKASGEVMALDPMPICSRRLFFLRCNFRLYFFFIIRGKTVEVGKMLYSGWGGLRENKVPWLACGRQSGEEKAQRGDPASADRMEDWIGNGKTINAPGNAPEKRECFDEQFWFRFLHLHLHVHGRKVWKPNYRPKSQPLYFAGCISRTAPIRL